MYLTFSNLNSIHWIIKKRYKPLCTFQDISGQYFQDISVTQATTIGRTRISQKVILLSNDIFKIVMKLYNTVNRCQNTYFYLKSLIKQDYINYIHKYKIKIHFYPLK